MIIRATAKLLNISRIKPVKNLTNQIDQFPGEWYASLISLSFPGKLAIHFLHSPTLISILIPGKSLTKVIPELPNKVRSFLSRNGFPKLETKFQLDTEPEIYATNSKSILSHMNQLGYNIEYRCAMAESLENIDYNTIEDNQMKYLFGIPPNKYVMPVERLKEFYKDL